MKITYIGPLPEVHVSGLGKVIRGTPVEAAKDIAKTLLARKKDWTEVKSTTFKSRIVEKGGKKSGGKK